MTSVHASTHSADAAGNGPLTSPASNPSPVYSSIAVDDVELDHVHGETKTQPQKGIRPCRNAINQGWARRLLFHPGTSLGLIFFGVLGLFCLRNRTQNLFTNEGSACRSDGFFSLSFGTSTTWMSDSAFSIDINFGNLSFAQAKLVDIWWNVGIGRGAQVILAIFTHSIFSRSLTCIMETSSVPYDTFKATTLQDNTFHGLLSLSLSLSRYMT